MDEVAERFLDEENEVAVPALDPLDRARFARLVRMCVASWSRHRQTHLRATRGRYGMALQFEGPLGGKMVSIFALRAIHTSAEYRFVGPNADRKRLGLGEAALDALERLRDLYEAFLSKKQGGEMTINALLKGKNFPDLVPLVEETRRILDGGAEGVANPGGSRRSSVPRARKPAAVKAPAGLAPAAPSEPDSSAAGSAPTPNAAATSGDAPAPTAAVSACIELACSDPRATEAFYRKLLGVKAVPRKKGSDPFIFELGPVTLVVREELSSEERRVHSYGTVSRNRGWGATIVLTVPDIRACTRRARRMREFLVEQNEAARTLLLRDPSGYVVRLFGT